jgi:uncharacterized protein (DUF2236 family)
VSTPAEVDFDIRPYVDGIGAFLAGTANVIMQLSRPGVGYGVVESPVDSGKATLHPIKRFRTTFTYLSVAMLGGDDDCAVYRAAVNTSHRQVRSGPDSPVEYNAFDPQLQLWVAACLYWGFADVIGKLHGELDDDTADALYRYCARFGTTLQVRPELWPADRAAFERYWADGLTKVHIDDTVGGYLYGVMTLRHMPALVRRLRARSNVALTTGFLPQRFRDEMGLAWSAADERRFQRRLAVVAAVNRRLPGPIRRFPFNFFLWDLRRRVRHGRPLV